MSTFRPKLTYTGVPEQRDKLVQAMQELNKHEVSLERLKNDCEDWWNNEVRPQFDDNDEDNEWTVSKATLSNLKKGDVPKQQIAAVLYAFLSGPWGVAQPITDTGLGGVLFNDDDVFADAILRRFGQHQPISYSSLLGLTTLPHGIASWWEAYRPSWQKHGQGHVIRSHVHIEKRNTTFWLVEEQRFKFLGKPLVEIDQGLLFPFALAVACLSTSGDDNLKFNGNCMKVYSLTERTPSPSEYQQTSLIKGTVMAVSNQGPHWSGPIVMMRRNRGELRPLDHLPIDDFREEGDPEIDDALDHLISNENTGHLGAHLSKSRLD